MSEERDRYPLGPPHYLVTGYAPGAPRGRAADLGAGRGQHALYLAEGFDYEVDAVDDASRKVVSGEGPILGDLARLAYERKLPIHVYDQDLFAFDLGVARYGLIIAMFSLHFSPEKLADFRVRMQDALVPGGRLVAAFITGTVPSDPEPAQPHWPTSEEVAAYEGLATDLHILRHVTSTLDDPAGHAGAPYPHWHRVLELVAEKKRAA